ncbi:mask [Symbiodinium microadriaticum]|nr:mask [Symbiodinium microadriaticum]
MVLKCMGHLGEDEQQVPLDRVIFTALGAAGLVLSTPGAVCAFFPVLLGLASAEERLEELQRSLDPAASEICWGTFLRNYGAAEQYVATVVKDLYSTITWLLGASLLYTLTQCFSVWVWIDKVNLAPISVYVTYALAVLYGSAFATGYGLFSSIEQHHGQIVGAVAQRLAMAEPHEEVWKCVKSYQWVTSRPLRWKVPLSPKWPMAPTLERLQAAVLVASFATRLGIQLLQGVVKVKEELAHARIKDITPDVMLCKTVKGQGCTPAPVPTDEMRKRFFEQGSHLRRQVSKAWRRIFFRPPPPPKVLLEQKIPPRSLPAVPVGPPRTTDFEMQLVLHSSPAAFALSEPTALSLLAPLVLGLLIGIFQARCRRTS